MDSVERRIERLEYYQRLMIGLVEIQRWPFHHLVMNKQLTEEEVTVLFQLCEELTEEYKKQKAEGFVGFSPLLRTFKQYLNPKLSSHEVINSLYQEGLYLPLMTVLHQAMTDEENKYT